MIYKDRCSHIIAFAKTCVRTIDVAIKTFAGCHAVGARDSILEVLTHLSDVQKNGVDFFVRK